MQRIVIVAGETSGDNLAAGLIGALHACGFEIAVETNGTVAAPAGVNWLCVSPKAGAHGELCGVLAIKAAHRARGDAGRTTVLVPTSAHGTHPATAAFVGYQVREIAQTADGRVDLADLEAKLGPHVAAIMVTNPNTCGLFERDIIEIARLTHAAGAFFYCDGANFNAIVGKVRPGDLGVDAMHINLHKTFSTPHGGGGPGPVRGPGALCARALPGAWRGGV